MRCAEKSCLLGARPTESHHHGVHSFQISPCHPRLPCSARPSRPLSPEY